MSRRNRIAAGMIVLGGAITYLTAPLWVPVLAVGRTVHVAGKGIAKFAHTRPHHTTAILTAGLLAYGLAHNEHAQDIAKSAAYDVRAAIVEYRQHKSERSTLESALEQREPSSEEVPLSMHDEQGFVFYFTKPGDTLSGISSLISGSGAQYPTIMRDNGIEDPRQLVAGQLLRLRQELCTRHSDQVYRRVPDLESVVLTDERISERFPDTWQEVLALNHDLGIGYEDAYKGSRVVHYLQ